MKNILSILLIVLPAVFFSQNSTTLTDYKNKGDKYAILYYERGGAFQKDYLKVIYSNEVLKEEDLIKKFKLDVDTTNRPETYQVLMMCFKYLNTQGYRLVTSTENVNGYSNGNKFTNPYKEYVFVKPAEIATPAR